MKRVLRILAISLSIAAVWAADKDARFTVRPAADYPHHAIQEQVTVAAAAYVNDDEARRIFGKKNPYQYGILPVLVVIRNDTGKTVRLNLEAEYIDPREHHLEATPAGDVQFAGAAPKRKDTNIGIASPIPLPRKKPGGPLSGGDFEGRGFAARMVPPGEQVSGFFYFQTRLEPGSKLYLNGLSIAGSNKELFYFEIPLAAE